MTDLFGNPAKHPHKPAGQAGLFEKDEAKRKYTFEQKSLTKAYNDSNGKLVVNRTGKANQAGSKDLPIFKDNTPGITY